MASSSPARRAGEPSPFGCRTLAARPPQTTSTQPAANSKPLEATSAIGPLGLGGRARSAASKGWRICGPRGQKRASSLANGRPLCCVAALFLLRARCCGGVKSIALPGPTKRAGVARSSRREVASRIARPKNDHFQQIGPPTRAGHRWAWEAARGAGWPGASCQSGGAPKKQVALELVRRGIVVNLAAAARPSGQLGQWPAGRAGGALCLFVCRRRNWKHSSDHLDARVCVCIAPSPPPSAQWAAGAESTLTRAGKA